MNWRRYSGTIEFRKGQKERIAQILRDFPVAEFFVNAGTYYLIDGVYPDVTKELVATLERIRGHTSKVKIQIGAAHIRDVVNWAEETYTHSHNNRSRLHKYLGIGKIRSLRRARKRVTYDDQPFSKGFQCSIVDGVETLDTYQEG